MFTQPKRAEARLPLRDRVRDESEHAALSDVVLAVRAKDGDRLALEALVERHAPRVRRLAAYLLDDPQDAEDAAQEALAKVITRSPTPAATSASASAGAVTSRWRSPPSRPRPASLTTSPASASSARRLPAAWTACPPTSAR